MFSATVEARMGPELRRLCRQAVVAAMVCSSAGSGGLEAQERLRAPGGTIVGRVLVDGTNEGLADVEVRVLGTSFGAVTDGRGVFRIDPTPAGVFQLRFTRLGYAVRTDSVEVEVGAVVSVTAAMSGEPVEVAPLHVTVRSAVLDRSGFYDRRSQGVQGYFLERQDIEDRQPDSVTDLFRRMNGIRVIHGGLYGSQVLVNQRVTFRDSAAGCEPAIWLDGIRSTMRTPDVMRVEELEGIEVYTGASAPGKFNDLCGVIVIWTRHRRAKG
ncbi:MAG: TonB-dependent receptor [Gemmatimonadota bacterium]|nr:TonB-dependent receptor [Gemmatimonadota bacterium]